ncbi:MAG: YbhN family protein [Solirubrobacteraceae bacterium]
MATQQTVAPAHGQVHLRRILIGALVIVVIGAAATLAGWDLTGWFKHLWDTITSVSLGYLLAGIALMTVQTTATAFAWYSILRYGYPDSDVRWIQVLACYAAAVALNSVLPANLGTLVMLLMFTTIIVSATFAGVLAGMAVQKIFFTLIGTFCYLYLFLTVDGSFSIQLGFVAEHPWATVILLGGVAMLLFLVGRSLRQRVKQWWGQAKAGAQILVHPRAFLGRVVLPEAISWASMLGIMAVFLAAYDIPVSFHTLMRIVAGNSIANVSSVTPGGAGVVQGFNVLSLKGVTSASNATAYSVSQQLVTTAWGLLFAIVLLIRAFGWSDGKTLVTQSYGQAREKSAEQSAARKAKRQARHRPGFSSSSRRT